MRQDALFNRIPRARGDRIQRAGRVYRVRGNSGGVGAKRRFARFRSESSDSHEEAVRGLRPCGSNTIQENGEYDLEGLFIRLGDAIERVGAKRVVLDTLESLFSGLSNQLILRSELRRLFRWLKDKGVTAIITAERGDGALTRHGLEEYVADCVVLLDHRVNDQVSTAPPRGQYRGSPMAPTNTRS
jgi:KaiC/GvpD/RAD55 family RecA-like ATPase